MTTSPTATPASSVADSPAESLASRPGADTRERILAAAETLLRRHGLAKTTVVDVARMLGMSHANVYRHFASKAELQDTLVETWLQQVAEPLTAIATRDEPVAQRVESWLVTLVTLKRRKRFGDPELFAAYHEAAEASRAVVDRYIAEIRAQLAGLIAEGVQDGVFVTDNPQHAAITAFDAVARFTHPHLVTEVAADDIEARAQRVVRLILAGLTSGAL